MIIKAEFTIEIKKPLVETFFKKKISEEFIKKLIITIKDKKFPIFFRDHNNNIKYHDIKLECNLNLYSQEILEIILNSIPKDDITEYAAVGFILAYIILLHPIISEINVYNRGEGLDYHWREKGNLIKLEISGCNTENKQIFYNRIWQKKTKFKSRYYGEPAYERLIGIVDFYYARYKLMSIE